MPAEYVHGNVRSACPDCGGTVTTFEQASGGREYGVIGRDGQVRYGEQVYGRTLYRLLRCASCGRGGLSTVHDGGPPPVMSDFYPISRETAPLPPTVPPGITTEYREAELCAAVRAYRAASALLRSVLEKTLEANGYKEGSLHAKIDAAAGDGIITAPRQRRAHENIRVLGNDVVHDAWRAVTAEEYAAAHLYAQRILEDFYDNPEEVEAILTKANRVKPGQP